ncbi:head-to-tail stopper [Gordonia phage Commandaria]|uniref:Head-to-tail stopper n=1 Tax=Gordonia phage Commandaria TaxID=3038364 RepID=A0AAF0GIG1_9CAUD|nr:head-to-tail stopper [Gordonia phage Commandaria]WGH20817.1 head-to-tail stopper [Gordonia phage Commandaria]
MIGLNAWVGGVDIEVWSEAKKDSWGDEKPAVKRLTLESTPIVPRTTTMATNDSFRERIESGYTMYLSAEQVAELRESDEFRVTFPSGQRVAFALDGSLEGLMWDMNPLSSINLGNEVNLKFLRRIGSRDA